ncbi:MAG: alpha amylase C-terminal domain-containing protein, partial [Bacteroidales bacterium]
SLQGTQVLIYSRYAAAAGANPESWALVLLNFSDADATVSAPFPVAGTWREMLDDALRPAPLEVQPAADAVTVVLQVPSNYGQIWVKTA